MSVRISRYRVQLVRESAIAYQIESRQIKKPSDASDLICTVIDVESLHVENFGLITLDTKNKVIGLHVLHVGTLSTAAVHPRNIFQAALLNNAASFIMFHNHPSGDPSPSPEDINFTKRIMEIGELMGIDALDHVIVCADNRYVSIKEFGI